MAKQNPLLCSLQQTVETGNARGLGTRTRLYLATWTWHSSTQKQRSNFARWTSPDGIVL